MRCEIQDVWRQNIWTTIPAIARFTRTRKNQSHFFPMKASCVTAPRSLGNAISWIMMSEGLSFNEAKNRLRPQA